MDLEIFKNEKFGQVSCDFYKNENNDIYMTREQIGAALEYGEPRKTIAKIHERNKERLEPLSVVVKLMATDGKTYNTTLYSAKGICEICRFSKQPKANAFFDWVYDVIESIRKSGAIGGNSMNELFKVEINKNQEQVISGRELHKFLEVKERYTQWVSRMIDYGFTENIDFVPVSEKTESGGASGVKVIQNHILKLSMAKELCMLARSDKGKQARLYFIRCEEAWNKPDAVMSRALVFADKQIKSLNEINNKLALENQTMKPKAEYFDALVDRNLLTNFRITAKEFHMKPSQFTKWLLDKRFVYRDANNRLQPRAGYEDYFHIKDVKGKSNSWCGTQTLITPKGKEAFRLILGVREKLA